MKVRAIMLNFILMTGYMRLVLKRKNVLAGMMWAVLHWGSGTVGTFISIWDGWS
jgi:hypothetical protein